MLSKCFDLMYGASLENKEDIFYKSADSEDVIQLAQVTEFHEPKDPSRQLEQIQQAYNRSKYLIAVGSKAILRDSKF